MEVILRRDLPNLGKAYEVVKVKPGFARNYLLAKGLAFKVTKNNLKAIEKEKKSLELQAEKERRKFQQLKDRLTGKSFTILVATNEEEKLYASVSKQDILEAIKAEGIDIELLSIIIPQPIKELGIYEVEIRLKYEITTKIKIWVVKK